MTLEEIKSANLPIVWVLGGPGSGKGTQCEKIIAEYGFTHLSTGDLLRAEVKSGSERGKKLQEIMEKGELVPNAEVLGLLKDAIVGSIGSAKGFLIDGYPRERNQGIEFEKEVAPASLVLYFEAKEDTLVQRLLGRAQASGRADDNEETIKLRLQTFLKNNDQVLETCEGKCKRINAERSKDEVYADVQTHLNEILKK